MNPTERDLQEAKEITEKAFGHRDVYERPNFDDWEACDNLIAQALATARTEAAASMRERAVQVTQDWDSSEADSIGRTIAALPTDATSDTRLAKRDAWRNTVGKYPEGSGVARMFERGARLREAERTGDTPPEADTLLTECRRVLSDVQQDINGPITNLGIRIRHSTKDAVDALLERLPKGE
jgi:hypothetical protein